MEHDNEQILDDISKAIFPANDFIKSFNIELWSILTALRGPDDGEYKERTKLKNATTAVIRYTLLKRVRKLSIEDLNNIQNWWLSCSFDKEEYVELRKTLNHNHFCTHCRNAFDFLGLRWDELNPA